VTWHLIPPFFVLSQTEAVFFFIAAEDFGDKAWLAVFSGSVELVDCFRFSHAVTFPLGIECPSLTNLRTPATSFFIKHVMLRALVAQVSYTLAYTSDQEVPLCNEARLICQYIDALVAASSPELFCANLRVTFDEVAAAWRTMLVDEVDVEASGSEEIKDFLPYSAKGSVRGRLTDLLLYANPKKQYKKIYRRVTFSEVEQRIPGHFSNCFEQVPRVPSFAEALNGYARALQLAKGPSMGRPSGRMDELRRSSALDHLRLSMIALHAIINSQIFPPPKWLLQYPEVNHKRRTFAIGFVAGGVASALATAGAGAIVIAAAYIGCLVTGHTINNTIIRLRTPHVNELAMSSYDKLLRTAFTIAVADKQQEEQFPGNAAAEIRLRDWSDNEASTLHEMIGNHVGALKWPWPLPPSKDYALWFRAVAQIGRLRHAAEHLTNIGAIGPSRVGKSELMTLIFNIDRSVFSPGADDQARTLDVRAYRSGQHLFLDCPGLNEGSETARYATSFAMDLLDVFIVVLDYKEAATETTRDALRLLAGQLVERTTQPFRILLNRIDEGISPRTSADPDHWAKDIDTRKRHVIQELRRQLNNRDYVETLVSRPHPTLPDRRFICRARESLNDVVVASCLVLDDEDEIAESKRRILVELQRRGLLWDAASGTNSVKAWIKTICPEAFS
jgi:hypothetical protein